MTMEHYKRCWHCQRGYLCLVSGSHGYHTNHTDSRYCPECLGAINEALQHVPRKFEHDWVETTDVTLEQVLAWKKDADEARERARAEGKLIVVRITTPLFDLSGKRQERSGIVKGKEGFEGRTFEYRYWTSSEVDVEDVAIREEVERNLETGGLRPWRQL